MVSQPTAENSLRMEEIILFGRWKPEFPKMKISNSEYLESVFKYTKKKMSFAEDVSLLGIHAHKTNMLIWGLFMSASMKAVIHIGGNLSEYELSRTSEFVRDHPEVVINAIRGWEGQEDKFQQTDSDRDWLELMGKQIEFEWDVFPRTTVIRNLPNDPERLART